MLIWESLFNRPGLSILESISPRCVTFSISHSTRPVIQIFSFSSSISITKRATSTGGACIEASCAPSLGELHGVQRLGELALKLHGNTSLGEMHLQRQVSRHSSHCSRGTKRWLIANNLVAAERHTCRCVRSTSSPVTCFAGTLATTAEVPSNGLVPTTSSLLNITSAAAVRSSSSQGTSLVGTYATVLHVSSDGSLPVNDSSSMLRSWSSSPDHLAWPPSPGRLASDLSFSCLPFEVTTSLHSFSVTLYCIGLQISLQLQPNPALGSY